MRSSLETAAAALAAAAYPIALTGAGISVESGIPAFRGAHGIWAKYDPAAFASIEAYLRDPPRVWRFWCELNELVKGCRPNPAHTALAELEAMGRLKAIITQNIDNLHQEAGSRRVVEFHGNAHWQSCLQCQRREPFDPDHFPDSPPRCLCGGLIKPDIVMFGEAIPLAAMAESNRLVRQCDLVLIVGTSAQVYPAAGIPFSAKANGAHIVECNIEPTEFTDRISDIYLEGPAGITLPHVVAAMQQGPRLLGST